MYVIKLNKDSKSLTLKHIQRSVKLVHKTSNITLKQTGRRGPTGPEGPAGEVLVESVNGEQGVVVLTTADISDNPLKRYTNDTDISRLAGTSGTNTGDQDLSGYATTTALTTGLALKEDTANKSTSISLGTSNTLFPTQNAVKSYVDTNIATGDNLRVLKAGDTMTGGLILNAPASGSVGQITITPATSVSGTSLLNFNLDRAFDFAQIATGAGTSLALRALSSDKYFDVFANGTSTRALSVYSSTTTANNTVGIGSQPVPGQGALQIAAAIPSGLSIFNTTDQTTNTERLRAYFSANTAQLRMESAGTGVQRDFVIGTANNQITFTETAAAIRYGRNTTTGLTTIHQFTVGQLNQSSGNQTLATFDATINQTSGAGYTVIGSNITTTAVGSGARYLLRFTVASTDRFFVTDAGSATFGNGLLSTDVTVRGNGFNGFIASVYSDTNSPYNFFNRSRGTFSSPTATQNNDFLGSFGFRSHTGSAFVSQDAARFSAVATQTTSTTHGGALVFYTVANGSLVSAGASERMRVDHSGNVRIGSAAAINSRLTFDSHTTASGGILMGTDVNLYRLTTSTLRTDGILSVGSNVTAGGTGQFTSGLRTTNIIMSPESSSSNVLPYYENDIAYNRLRGGATRVYLDGVLQAGTDANTDKLFEPTADAFGVTIGAGGVQTVTEVVIEIDLFPGGSYSFGTKVGFAVNEAWRARNVKVEVYTPATATWTVLANETGVTYGEKFWQHGGSSNPISMLRFTFSDWAGLAFNSFRLGSIYLLNYASQLGAAPFMTRNGGNLFGSVTMFNGVNLVMGTGTGSQIGTASTQKLGFWGATPVARPAAYTVTNLTTDRSYDANSTTTDELADVLGTLIADLKSIGVIG